MTNWDGRFIELAKMVASWSKDPSSKVGAVIVDQNKRIVSIGFNGFPKGIADTQDRLNDRETKLKLVLHAEENAILFANRSLENCTVYIYPFPPCSNCMGKIIQSGIKRVVCGDYIPDRWKESFKSTFVLALEAGIDVQLVKVSE